MDIDSLPQTQADANDALPDAWDFRGRPASRSKTGGWIASAMILGVEGNERLTTLGIAVNLVTYLTGVMHLGNAVAANGTSNFLGTSFMLCLLGGFIADTFLGRYLTIAIFATVQALGATILTISTIIPSLHPPPCIPGKTECIPANGSQLGVLYLALYLLALGTGGVKASVSGFGSDQFDDSNKEERAQMNRFFSWFYFFINLGSLVAVTVLVYIQDNVGRRWGYGICACAIAVGEAIFLMGTKRYRFKKLVGSPLTQIASVVVAAWRKRSLEVPADASKMHDVADVEEDTKVMKKTNLPRMNQFRFLDKAAIKDTATTKPNKWQLSTLTDVQEVKMVLKMLPIWATTIIFWTVHVQMTTLSVAQATTMDRHIGRHFEIPAASLTAVFIGSILLTVPVYDRLISPLASRLLRQPHGLSPLQRIGVGLVFSIVAMAVAALTEIHRLRMAISAGISDNPEAVLPLTVFYLTPQFFIVGAGEAFIYMGQLDFFLKECPKGMKTMSTGLFLSTLSLGFFLSSILVTLVHLFTGTRHPWIADNLNEGRLYNFYWLLVVLSLINFVVFLVCSKRYVYNKKWLADEGFEVEAEEDNGPVCH